MSILKHINLLNTMAVPASTSEYQGSIASQLTAFLSRARVRFRVRVRVRVKGVG